MPFKTRAGYLLNGFIFPFFRFPSHRFAGQPMDLTIFFSFQIPDLPPKYQLMTKQK
jgi:hypothetical protein